ncbi:MAG: hypothetical protein RBS77_00610 [Candidatus Moranbacteria bacterium]|jgi:hypothetical protein|nr:hypothetical protein [Candidatus Moranbacteria bacterium]
MSEEKTGKKCHCGGEIVERFRIPYIPAAAGGEDLIGFGSFNVATERDRQHEGYHCDSCGIEYHKLPKV